MADQGPGPSPRRGSSLRALRRQQSTPYGNRNSGSSGSTGLTDYFGNSTKLSFEEGPAAEGQAPPPPLLSSARGKQTIAGKALGAISFVRGGKDKEPQEVSIWKPNVDDVLGITFEVPEVLTACIHTRICICYFQFCYTRC